VARPRAHAGDDNDDDQLTRASAWDPVGEAEGAALDAAFDRMIRGARSVNTLRQYRTPFLKLASWITLRGGELPPSPVWLRRYLVFIIHLRRNKSAAEAAVRALHFVCWLNKWPSLSSSPECRVPCEAALRAFGGPTKKAPPFEPWMVVAIVRGTREDPLPTRMTAWAFLACFMIVGRYSDLTHLQLGDGYFESHHWGLRLFLERRKTDQQYRGQWIDIAENDAAARAFNGFSAVAELRHARAALGAQGPVLRRVQGHGRRPPTLKPPFFAADHRLAGYPMVMSREAFQSRVQVLLAKHCGLHERTAREYTTHGIRAGAATTLVKHEVPHHIIMDLAGVVSEDWIATYDRLDLDRRLACSRALGLKDAEAVRADTVRARTAPSPTSHHSFSSWGTVWRTAASWPHFVVPHLESSDRIVVLLCGGVSSGVSALAPDSQREQPRVDSGHSSGHPGTAAGETDGKAERQSTKP